MRNFLLMLLLLFGSLLSFAQSPHGDDFKMNCAACHNNDSWEIHSETWGFKEPEAPKRSKITGWILPQDSSKFNHYYTEFPLLGKHATTDCRQCHETLVFSEAKTQTECISCHTDLHRNTVGSDCARCHNNDNWLVDNITDLHVENGFPLMGVHAAASCTECHISESNLEFPRIGNDCISCHLDDFNQTTNPNHKDANFSTNCIECHTIDDSDWNTDTEIEHDFFPLTLGHEISDCAACHTGGSFEDTPTECLACHQTDFDNSLNPNHQAADFSTDCVSCHTTEVDWTPAEFLEHDPIFPIYSGAHDGHWTECMDCHQNQSNYAEFTCVNCHINPETDQAHVTVSGYAYENTACLACHPTGNIDDSFDHDDTNFPLTGEHIGVDCILCHTNGYEGTPTDCKACHTTDFEETTNPNHGALGLSNDCATCHTTDPDWMPATFVNHDDFWELKGAHTAIANDCVACHNGDYNNTPTDCFGCHELDFNQSTNPNHMDAQFPTDCTTCHDETAWSPSSFNHDDHWILDGGHAIIADDCVACHNGDYNNTPTSCDACHQLDFDNTINPNHTVLNLSNDCTTCHTTEPDWMPAAFPNHDDYYALNGAHAAISNDCAACHSGDYNNTPTDCLGCHELDFNQSTNPNHVDAQFPTDCATCHDETAWTPSSFNHDNHWVLDGEHATIANDCVACHNDDYQNTPTDCAGCHTDDFNATTNPNHPNLSLSTDCQSCHTTQPDWIPASFDIHDDFYPLNGAHALISNDCAACHNGDYLNTPNDCFGCHEQDYTNTIDPNHVQLQFSTDCATCHSESEWIPSTFDHDGMYFPIYSGEHQGEWDDCLACHPNPSNYAEFTCVSCHTNPDTDDEHQGVSGYVYEDNACLACHPTGSADDNFDHNQTNFPLTGAHIGTDCLECHSNGFAGTPTDCASCHQMDFDQTTNPNHNTLGLSTDCVSCHTTEAGWNPAEFANHDDYYTLNGAHTSIFNDCAACHNGDYNNTPKTCAGCHTDDFNATTDPDHEAAQFPIDCESCHTESAWIPSTFDHNEFYELTGGHALISDDCVACHQGDYQNTPNTCEGCHQQDFDNTINPNHTVLNLSTDCQSCHTTEPDWMPATFDIHDDFYSLNGAHAVIANDCAACHNRDYNNTPNTCFGCHSDDYNNTTDPDHQALQFSTDCISCHTENEWDPSTFDHDGQYFPIYSGEHQGEWDACTDCHTNPSNYAEFTCITCHTNPETGNEHNGVNGYVYESTACLACHPTGSADDNFDHNSTNFPLTGAHITVNCLECHANGYQGTPTDCESCHLAEFNQTTNPNHLALGLPTDCQSCHTTDPTWSPASMPNHDDFWVLDGAHLPIANNCVDCHNGDYNNTPNDCASCHTDDFNATTNPSHTNLGLSTDCEFCHTTEPEWMPATFAIHDDFYPLNGAHALIADDCAACHNGNYNNTPNTCWGCHEQDYTQVIDPNHVALQFPTDCIECHTESEWIPSTFNHDNYYVLDGEHAVIANDCNACHNGNYNNTPNTCDGCHIDDFNATTNPNHNNLGLAVDCESCHTTEPDWMPAAFPNHDDYWTLNGAHAAIADDCAACHNGNYYNTPTDCFGCHEMDYTNTTNPNHTALQFPTDCQDCHTETAWSPTTFDHDQFYVLDGGHLIIANDCNACHNGNYNNTPNTCDGCHIDDFNATTNPNHNNLGLSTDCESCHTTDPGWSPATFDDHNNYYMLTGAHLTIANDCAACHNGNYNNTPNTCNGCHIDDFNQSVDPNHIALGLPTDCETCHTTDPGWSPAGFPIHDDYYVLDGAHAAVANDCALCHANGYNNTPNTCDGCHIDDYNSSTNPNHAQLGIPTDCETCHTTDPGWMPAIFPIHDDFYVLDGAHAPIASDCVICHNGNYNNTPNTCDGCHLPDYNQSTNPNHVQLNIPTDCDMCHTTDPMWFPATFSIHDDFYPLNGAHALIANDCAVCHNGNYNNTPNTCIGCHQDDYNMATNPNHVTSQFPTTCDDCHSETAWIPATFDHNTVYPLTGGHAIIANDCNICHQGNYNNTPNTCDGCHMPDYNQTTNPNHPSIGLPVDCNMCHTTDPNWMPATFPIHNQFYPLNGAHAAIANNCVDCHNGNYNNTPNTCYGCHQSDYNNATNPNHQTAGFPTDCEQCHNENAWSPSTFDHDGMYFPIYSGKHKDEWNQCNECHTTPGNFAVFSCIDCHEHDDPVESADDHQGVSGYVYQSSACYACHPNGED
jgi:hypothetical protein